MYRMALSQIQWYFPELAAEGGGGSGGSECVCVREEGGRGGGSELLRDG